MKKYEVHMDALDAMRGLLNATSSQREALHMSAEDAAEEFSVDGLMTDYQLRELKRKPGYT